MNTELKEAVSRIQMEDYNYPLPDDRIAKYPLPCRSDSKLLVYRGGSPFQTRHFRDLPEELDSDMLLVFNNTKVIQARLMFQKKTGGWVEIFCLEPERPSDYQLMFAQTGVCVWKCLVGNLKKWKEGVLQLTREYQGAPLTLTAERLSSYGNTHDIKFSWDREQVTWGEVIETFGELPIPPYLKRRSEESDKKTYQTVYSKIKGSVAAPTAGLHFTPEVLEQVAAKGVETAYLTLHVGAGTFQPVKTEAIGGHDMHTEVIAVPCEVIEKLLAHEGRVVAVGTTSVRTLESLYYIGCHLKAGQENLSVSQWEPYETDPQVTTADALHAILDYLERQGTQVLHARTQIIIAPGYRFHVVRGIVTNFHQPKSTLLLLLAAYVGDVWRDMYDYALREGYRSLSYGDSSLLLR
ncbi:MAG: S-adenosylmethionine:tRNA ribosyltransferase-isomerase [Paludibacteraceae bacterium]|nr:S-adenosylmethionine:tRNA ribosyltransferase-isomerase [Paludibacteraceae bacterium]